MRKPVRPVSRREEGSVSVEALGFAIVLIGALTLIILIGSAYWNLTIMNTTASSASLAAQALINTDCAASRPNAACTARAQSVVNDITSDITCEPGSAGCNSPLIFANRGTMSMQLAPPTTGIQAYPSDLNSPDVLPACWSYAFVSVKTQFKPIGSSTIPVRGASMSAGYQPIC